MSQLSEITVNEFVFVGLGNPGINYAMTRHNLGQMVVQKLAFDLQFEFKKSKQFNSLVCNGIYKEKKLHFVIPQTYMNLSGRAVRDYLHYYKLSQAGLVVVSDDTSLAYGSLLVKQAGGAGGHNGLKNIIAELNSDLFTRLKMGIGKPMPGQILADYVLNSFSAAELESLTTFLNSGRDILEQIALEGADKVMNRVNFASRSKQNNKENLVDLTNASAKGLGES